MATPAWVPLASTTLSSSASSVTFGSLPSYRDYILVAECSTTVGTDLLCHINGDSADTNYSRVRASGNGTSTFSGTTTPRSITYYGTPGTTDKSNHIIQFLDGNATDKHKVYLTRSNRGNNGTDMVATRYATTSALSSIALVTSLGSFNSGSTFSLWGRNAL